MPPKKEGKSGNAKKLAELTALQFIYKSSSRLKGVAPLAHISKQIEEAILELSSISMVTLRGPDVSESTALAATLALACCLSGPSSSFFSSMVLNQSSPLTSAPSLTDIC